MAANLEARIRERVAADPSVSLALVFGSLASGRARPESDLDLAVAGPQPLTAGQKILLIADLALLSGRPVDLVDLRTAGSVLLDEVLRHGRFLYLEDRNLYAELIKRRVFDHADWLPYRDRILAERRRRWINAS